MKFLKYLMLLANIISGLTLIPYSFISLFLFVMAHDAPSSNFIKTTLPALAILSIYPTGIIASIYYSWKFHLKNKDILACCIAYIPVIIAFGVYMKSGYSPFHIIK